MALWRDENLRARSEPQPPKLVSREKAFSLLSRLRECHYDNCKVTFVSRTAYRYALRALLDGHDQARIVGCYADALWVRYGFAVIAPRRLSAGARASTHPRPSAKRASYWRRTGLTCARRVRKWYDSNPRRPEVPPEPFLTPEEVRARDPSDVPARLRTVTARTAASFAKCESATKPVPLSAPQPRSSG